MKRNSSHIITALLLAAVLCAVSCTREELLEPQNVKTAFSMVGNPVEVHLDIAVNGLSVDAGTRAEEPTADYDHEDTEDERHVDDLWVFEYDASGDHALVGEPQYVKITDQRQLADVPVTLADNEGNPVYIYVVTNSGSGVEENSEGWVAAETSGNVISYPGFMTFGELEANTIPTPHPMRMTWDETSETYVLDTQDAGNVSIPMSGYISDVTVQEWDGSDDSVVVVPVARMFAKLLVRVDLSEFNTDGYSAAWLNSVTVGNIPEYCRVGTLWDGEKGDSAQRADYSDCGRWLRRAFNSVGETSDDTGIGTENDDAVYPYLIYVPENIQGENGSSENKADNVPNGYALTVTAGIYAETNGGGTIGEFTSYVAYPGGNNTTNFNVRRNCLYCVTLRITELIDDVLPSANCIVCLSGETTVFWPYCRTETGGGYKFEDYLDAYGDDDSKKISYVRIIWQSTNGGNTVNYDSEAFGYIGDNSEGDLVWIDDLGKGEATDEYHRKIHVTIPEGSTGNALVGAYNSSNEIVWSWHIWSRARANDPTTVNTKLYYTYEWDSNGIYTDRARVAGYTTMNCNLGAMQDEPSGSIYATNSDGFTGFSRARPTFGTLYQWGRKDPFPPITAFVCDTDWGGTYIKTSDGGNGPIDEFNVAAVGNYFDNENNAVTIVGTDDASALFHSVSGEERKEFDEMIPLSIQNPTVFYAGTNAVNSLDVRYERTELATNLPVPKDGNWIFDGDGDHFNRLWGGLDPENADDMAQITKSFNTGYTCTVGDVSGIPVYLYDDYGEKSIFDPCPYGWRVSPPDLWLGFTGTGLNAGNLNNVNYNTDEDLSSFSGMTLYLTAWREGETSFFPCQGTRAPDGCVIRTGQCGNYSNATADANDRVNILHIHNSGTYFNIFEREYMDFYIKSTADPLRCVRIDSVEE